MGATRRVGRLADLDHEASACFQEARSEPRAAPALHATNTVQAATNRFMSGISGMMEGWQEGKLWQECMERRNRTLVPRDEGSSLAS